MGCKDLPWMQQPAPSGSTPVSEELLSNDSQENEVSAAEYGIATVKASPFKQSSNTKHPIGSFIDLGDGQGPRFLLTEKEISYIHKHFFLMQLARDEFIVKYSILDNLSPERL